MKKLLLLLLLAACTPRPGTQSGTGATSPDPTTDPPAAGCTSNTDCGEGQMCTGPAGCDTAWTCQPNRPCTRDLREYCSCDGETVRGSGSCPPAPYEHEGACTE
jgi:hypothetical protein